MLEDEIVLAAQAIAVGTLSLRLQVRADDDSSGRVGGASCISAVRGRRVRVRAHARLGIQVDAALEEFWMLHQARLEFVAGGGTAKAAIQAGEFDIDR